MKYPMHRRYPEGVDSWCKCQRTRALDKPFKDKSTKLPQHIINIVKPMYMKLCDQQLLCKCLHDKTQNAIESFNGMLWNFVPKLHFVELQIMQLEAFMSVLQFKCGTNDMLSVLNYLNLRVGSHTLSELTLIEKERIQD
ncbi:hypothetical protein AVEN_199273-1 [Araneus ventricosus]|uniref:Uncharacterized protein n=1 Tax=Araneus ventricosus TaxID=182803 RepID=A0A4Y2K0H4_ARAVE|nr:hypothetical protein AVEN_199273-1 [Araneus ventricosus]